MKKLIVIMIITIFLYLTVATVLEFKQRPKPLTGKEADYALLQMKLEMLKADMLLMVCPRCGNYIFPRKATTKKEK